MTITRIQCGASHSLAITAEGRLYTWGKNSQGQCGLGHTDDVLQPTLVIMLAEWQVAEVAAGWEHTLAVTTDGKH